LAVLGADEQDSVRCLAAALHTGADRSWREAAAHVAAAWRDGQYKEAVLEEAAQHAERNLRLNRSGRILVDATWFAPDASGAPATGPLRELVSAMCECAQAQAPIELVRFDGGTLYRASTAACALLLIDAGVLPAEQIDIQPGDVLFLPDTHWNVHLPFLPVFEALRQFGGRIVAVAPSLAEVTGAPEGFATMVRHSDLLLCRSQAESTAILAHIAGHMLEHPAGLRVLPWEGDATGALALLRASVD
jgi:hypothetical protein